MKIFTGTSGYGYKEWKGKFYPEKLSAKKMLGFYSERFGAVEINNTFYRMPTEGVLKSWAGQVPEDFVFAIKAPQVITHRKRLKNVDSETEFLFRSLSALDRKLGPVLFQFSKTFHSNPDLLKDFLSLIPSNISCAFEFRSPSWLNTETISLLHEKRHSLCLEDTDENPANEIISAASWGYLRLRRSDYTDADLSQWMERILEQQWREAFVFFKHEDEAKGPAMAMRFHELTDLKRAAA
ncbi:MAG: DUF72 domain-containing protein [Desulfomonilaceae bacterium]